MSVKTIENKSKLMSDDDYLNILAIVLPKERKAFWDELSYTLDKKGIEMEGYLYKRILFYMQNHKK